MVKEENGGRMDTFIQLLNGLGSLLSSLVGNMPKDEKIKHNIELLKAELWFLEIYNANHDFISKDQNIRYIIGKENINKILRNPKRKKKFQIKIEEALQQK